MASVVGAAWIENWSADGYRVFLKLGAESTKMIAAGLCEKYAVGLRNRLSEALRKHDDLHPEHLRDLVVDVISE